MTRARRSVACGLVAALAVLLPTGVLAGDAAVVAPPPPAVPQHGPVGTWSEPAKGTRTSPSAAPRMLQLPEVEPNDTIAQAQAIPVGFGAGQDVDVVVTGSITPYGETDAYKVSAKHGDIIGLALDSGFDTYAALTDSAGVIQMDNDDFSGIPYLYPPESPMPLPLDPRRSRNSTLTFMVMTEGDYFIAVQSFQGQSGGGYALHVVIRRPFLETEDINARQIVFVDFDGPSINPYDLFNGEGKTSANVSPMRQFLPAWGLTAEDESAVIDSTMATLKSRYDDLRSPPNPNPTFLNGNRPVDNIPGHYDIAFQNSRDNDKRVIGQPNVLHLIIGGTIAEVGIDTIGIASCIDPGNFKTDDACIVLLDILSCGPTSPFFAGNSLNDIPYTKAFGKINVVGLGVGMVAAHEICHLFGNAHTDPADARMALTDSGGLGIPNLVGVGADGTLGTADDVFIAYVPDFFNPVEGLAATRLIENTPLQTSFALSTGTKTPGAGTITLRPDLIPGNLIVRPDPLVAGTPFTVTFRVSNVGAAPATDFICALFLNQPRVVSSSAGAAATVQVSGPLNPGEFRTVEMTSTYPSSGDFMLSILVDSENSLAESNEMNNMLFQPVTVLALGCDLVVKSVTVTQPNPGFTAGFDATVENRGMTGAGPFQVGFYASLGGAPTAADAPTSVASVANMAARGVITVHFDLPPQDRPRAGFAWFFADWQNTVSEENESNNTARAAWGVPNDPFTIGSALTATPAIGGVGEAIQFDVSASDPNGDPIFYAWDFGDGSTQNGGASATHAYGAQGFYTASVTVSDGPFHIQTYSVGIEITQDIVDLDVYNGGPVKLSAKKGRFKLRVPWPTVYFPAKQRLKSMLVEGDARNNVKYRNFVVSGKAPGTGVFSLVIEFQSKKTHEIKRLRYRFSVVN